MAISNVQIANRALQKLGAKRIESLSQDHPNARSMNACFEPLRKRLLRAYPWSFAIKRASVAADASQTEWGDLNRYALPGDFIRLLLDDESSTRVDWKIENGFIVTADDAPLQFRYIADITDPTMYDSAFAEALSALLARETCEEITGSTGKLQLVQSMYTDAVAEARLYGALESGPIQPLEDDWVLARL